LAEPRYESRPLTRAEVRQILLMAMGVDIDDEQSISRFAARRQWIDAEKTRRDAAKERTLAYGAGFIRWLAAGAGTAIVGWLSGAIPWLKAYLVTRG
jgi:hypothetical protein